MIEHSASVRVFFTGDVNAGLLIKPPVGKPEVIGNLACLLQEDSVRLEHRIDITSHARSVVGHGHRGTANHKHVRYDSPSGQPLPKRREGSFDLFPAKEDVTRLGHAASRSLAGPEIARELYVSSNTVKSHVRNLYAKLGTPHRAETVIRARDLGLLAPSAGSAR